MPAWSALPLRFLAAWATVSSFSAARCRPLHDRDCLAQGPSVDKLAEQKSNVWGTMFGTGSSRITSQIRVSAVRGAEAVG